MKQSHGTFKLKAVFTCIEGAVTCHKFNLKLFHKNIFFHISENSQENTCAGFIIKIQAFLFRTTILHITRTTASEFWHIATVELRRSFVNFRFEILVLTYMVFFSVFFLSLTLISKSLLRKFERVTLTNLSNFSIF